MMIPFTFVRHGETDWNAKQIIMGAMDRPLNENGLQQAAAAREALRASGRKYDRIYASPLSRALTTAKTLNEVLNVELVIREGLRECNWGSLEGGPNAEVERWRAGEIVPHGAETPASFESRVHQEIEELLAISSGKRIMVVAHGYLFRMMCIKFGIEEFASGNCAAYHLEPAHPAWKITNGW